LRKHDILKEKIDEWVKKEKHIKEIETFMGNNNLDKILE
jgi:hypothetical protein